jgi:hypothetical protein
MKDPLTKDEAARLLGVSPRLIKSDFVTLEQIEAFRLVRSRVLASMPKPPIPEPNRDL